MKRGRDRNAGAGRRPGGASQVSSGIAREARAFAITPELALRLCSWSVELAQHLLPQGTPSYVLDGETRFGRKGALAVHHDGSWHDFEGDAHGHGALSLIAHLQADATPATVQAFARTWLQQHPGHGAHEVSGYSNDTAVSAREQARAEHAKQVLTKGQPIAGSEIEVYLQSRGLQIPASTVATYYPNARAGEAALVGILRKADGRPVGVQVGYVDPRGRKSALLPQRNLFMAETNRSLRMDAAFRISGRPLPADVKTKGNGLDVSAAAASAASDTAPPTATAPTDPTDPGAVEAFARDYAGVTLFTEGLENAIALHMAMPHSAIVGYPGIGHLRHQPVRAKQRVVVFKDGDATDAASTKTLLRGIDHLLISGADVQVTDTPVKADSDSIKLDANSVLQAGGIAAVQALIAGAKAAALSNDGQLRRLASLLQSGARLQYEQERVAVAKLLGIRRVTQIDPMVRALLPPLDEEDAVDEFAELPWETPVTDLAAVLDDALATMRRFVAAGEVYLAAAVVWGAHTHLVHSETVLLTVSPRLLISAVAENSGKTTLLQSVQHISARSLPVVSITAAALFRAVDKWHPSLFIDEADVMFARGGNTDLLSLINAGHARGGFVLRSVEGPDGELDLACFPVWGAVAMAAIGRVPVATTQSRCIVIQLRRAWAGEVPERLRPGAEEVFMPIRRKLVRWAQDLTALPAVPKLLGLDNRVGDNWEPLRQIAELAGGRWPELIARAAEVDAEDASDTGSLVPLLTDIRVVFGAQARLSTTEILEGLLGLEEPSAEWDRANRGREITAVWLSRRLRGALPTDAESLCARRWRVGGKTIRGYPVEQFDDAIRRYLSTTKGSDRDNDPAGEPSADTGNKSESPYAFPKNADVPGTATYYSHNINNLASKNCAESPVFGPGTTRHNPAQGNEPAHISEPSGAESARCAGLCRVVPGPKTAHPAQNFSSNSLIDNDNIVPVPSRTPFSGNTYGDTHSVSPEPTPKSQPQVEELSRIPAPAGAGADASPPSSDGSDAAGGNAADAPDAAAPGPSSSRSELW